MREGTTARTAHAYLGKKSRKVFSTDGTGKQTGFFIYDVWDFNAGPDGGHLTLPNVTNTDIFCGSQVVLPGGNAAAGATDADVSALAVAPSATVRARHAVAAKPSSAIMIQALRRVIIGEPLR